MNDATQREYLRNLIEELCLLEGSFVLSTGATSRFYFDCKRAMLDGEALSLSADAFLDEIDQLPPAAAIGGLTMGADFIVAAVIQRAYQKNHPVSRGSIVRKEPKKHGTQSRVENELPKGTRIVVVDDVITTGSSTRKACDELIRQGYELVGIVALVDREAGGAKSLHEEYGVPVRSVFRKSEFPTLASLRSQADALVAG